MATMIVRETDPEGYRPVRNNFQPGPVVTVVIVLITWLISASITYGILSTKIQLLEDRVSTLEKNQLDMLEHYLTREEYLKYNADQAARSDSHFTDINNKLMEILRQRR